MPDEIIEGLQRFFDYVWSDTPGYVYLPTINHGGQVTKYMYEWPRQRNAVVKHVVAQDRLGNDVFYAPAIFGDKRPERDNVKGSWVFWCDFDGNAPTSWEETAKTHSIPEPSFTVASSVEGREHAYWRLANLEGSISQIDSRNRALAYTLGADTSGWDASQFLRPPYTHNYGYNNKGEHKPWYQGEPVDVRITRQINERINPNSFNSLGTPERIVEQRIVLGDLPELTQVFMLGRWPEDFRAVFNFSKDEAASSSPDGRSGTLQRLGYYGAENGFSDEQLYVILKDADRRWEKYSNRADQQKRLLEIIARARVKHGYMGVDDLTFEGLLKDPRTEVVIDNKLVYSFKEFGDLDIKVDWMFDGLLRNEGMGIITGSPGVGKTQLIVQMGAMAGLGWDFFGWKCLTSPKKVLFMSLEMDKVPLSIFWKHFTKEYTPQIEELHRNFHVMPLGEGIPFETKRGQDFVNKLIEDNHPDLIIVDSLQKVTAKPLTDEIAAKVMLEFIDTLRIRHHTSFVFVHHNRKKGQDAGTILEDLDDMYGSRYIGANVEFVLNVRRITKNVNNLSHIKNRLGETVDSFDITRNTNLQYLQGTDDMMPEGLMRGAFSHGTLPSGASEPGKSGGLFKLD